MSSKNSGFWKRIRRAHNQLVDQFLDHPDVDLIDIGYIPAEQAESSDEIVLRIHVREKWLKAKPEERVAFPKQMDGIMIIVMLGDYQLEDDVSRG